MKRSIVGMFLLLAYGAAVAADTSSDAIKEIESLYLAGLLAPRSSSADRAELVDRLQSLAEAGNDSPAYLLGALYAQGFRHPARLFERDREKAEYWYLRALEAGQISAMAKLAELKLVQGQAQAAMGWAQLYARFCLASMPGNDHTYSAELIVRMFASRPKLTQEEATAEIDALLAVHKPLIDKGLALWLQQRDQVSDESAPLEIVRGYIEAPPEDPDTVIKTPSSMVEFVVSIGPNGRVANVWLLDAVPDHTLGQRLLPKVKMLRFNKIAGKDQRLAIVPIIYTRDRFKLAPGNKLTKRKVGQDIRR